MAVVNCYCKECSYNQVQNSMHIKYLDITGLINLSDHTSKGKKACISIFIEHEYNSIDYLSDSAVTCQNK